MLRFFLPALADIDPFYAVAVMIKLIAGQLDCGIAAACRREYGIKALHRDIGISLCAFGNAKGQTPPTA